MRELQGKTITKGDSLRKNAAPVSSSQLSRPDRQFDLDSHPLEGTSKSFLQQGSSKFSDHDYRGPASSQVEERDKRIYWSVWVWWPGTSDPQEYKALVDTGAQCTLMPSDFKGSESICISGVTEGPKS